MSNFDKEIRSILVVDGMKFRTDAQTDQRFVDGLGIVYDRTVELWPGYKECIDKDVFTECLSKNPEIKSMVNHDVNQLLSTTLSDPPLVINNTSSGLFFSAPIPNTQAGRDLIELLKNNSIRGASFAFTVDDDDVSIDADGCYVRHIKRGQLLEVGPVVCPAYEMTQIGLRSRDEIMAEARARTSQSTITQADVDMIEAAQCEAKNVNNFDYRNKVITLLEIENN